jgi:hypothetical protein
MQALGHELFGALEVVHSDDGSISRTRALADVFPLKPALSDPYWYVTPILTPTPPFVLHLPELCGQGKMPLRSPQTAGHVIIRHAAAGSQVSRFLLASRVFCIRLCTFQ